MSLQALTATTKEFETTVNGMLEEYKRLGDCVDAQLPSYIMQRTCIEQLSEATGSTGFSDKSEEVTEDQKHLSKLKIALEQRFASLHTSAKERDEIRKALLAHQEELNETIISLQNLRGLVANVIVPPLTSTDGIMKVVAYNESPLKVEEIGQNKNEANEATKEISLIAAFKSRFQLNDIAIYIAYLIIAISVVPLLLRLFNRARVA